MIDIIKMKEAIQKLETVEREDYGDLSTVIGQNAMDEAYENDKQLHNLFAKHKNDDQALAVINETLICVCGWFLETLVERIGL